MACGLAGAARAQTAPNAAVPPAPPPPPATDAAPQRVEITGDRAGGSDVRERRESTVARTVVGREDIERFGDATLGEVLRRLPGVTLDGAPGRGGNPRLRGLGGGYTQILLDGERVPPGFEIDSLAPEQIERIEILRAPTAETGARAIAGTINIVTRDSVRRRLNDLRLSANLEHGRWSPGLNWTRNGSADALSWTFTLSATQTRGSAHSDTTLEREAVGEPVLRREEGADARNERLRLGLNGRLQWRLGEGEAFTLTPVMFWTDNDSRRSAVLAQPSDPASAPWAGAATEGGSRFGLGRLSALRTQRLADGTRLEWRASVGHWESRSDSRRTERDATGRLLRTYDDRSQGRDDSWSAGVKASTLLADAHSGVAGLELEGIRREETRSNLLDGVPRFPAFADGVQARSQRIAAYVQDEWEISPHWAAHAGLRWEAIETRGDGPDGEQGSNRSSVWSPLLHAVWKPDPKGRDQLRASLTRSYRALTLGSLLGRVVPSTLNSPTSPDRSGNPALRPELATGLDLTYEHYLGGNAGLLSAGVFQREISGLVRNETRLETLPGAGTRWVNRPYNVGDATVRGLELEAKFPLRVLLAGAPAVDLRAGASFFRSRVHDVPGPDNRVERQPGRTASLGADWRLRAVPLTLGANLAWTPGYVTRLSATELDIQGRKPAFDAYGLWTFSPTLALRVSATNLSAPDWLRGNVYDSASLREASQTVSRSYVDWLVRLEMKL